MLRLFLSTSILLLTAFAVVSQTTSPTTRSERRSQSAEGRSTIETISESDDTSREFGGREGPLPPFVLSKAAREKIKLTSAEKSAYKRMADEADLKILKMFSAPKCASKPLVLEAGDEECASAADLLRVSFFSFTLGFYGERIGHFRILENDIIAGNGRYQHGLLVDLGPVDIAGLDKKSTAVAELHNYPIALTINDESKQRKALIDGFRYKDFDISSRKPIKKNHVYLLRLVSYGIKTDRISSVYFRDGIYVLKVEEPTPERTSVVLWRRLTEKGAPMLKD